MDEKDDQFEALSPELERWASVVVDSALKVHRTLGPGLLESVYETCLAYELTKRGLKVARQVRLPIEYEGMVMEETLRIDILVEDQIIIEVKAVEQMIPVFQAQMLTYLKLAGKRLGFLINFNVPVIKQGIKRIIR